MSARTLARVVAILLLTSMVENWRLIRLIAVAREPVLRLVCTIWVGLFVGSVASLFRPRRWGAIILLILAVYSTVFLTTPLIPGCTS